MIYSEFQGKRISRLGFGCMRLPCIDGKIDEELTEKMFAKAIAEGVNYFDTAYPYHGGMSEVVVGKILKRYPRESFYLADKFPGHQISETYDVKTIFEEQLKKCGVDYFDFYLLHNVYEKSAEVYKDKRWGILDYLLEQKKNGRIKHLGFSFHGRPDCLVDFLDFCGEHMEFCQIQMNYLDWTLQDAERKYEILSERGIPVWVMEPVRGGRLCNLSKNDADTLKKLRPDDSIASWAFRWIQQFPKCTVILSGMSAPEQVEDNLKTFSTDKPLSDAENELLARIAEYMKNSIPCTACRYCTDGCPAGLDIPTLIHTYNDIRFGIEGGLTAAMQLDALPESKRSTVCIGCGNCAAVCPQKIDIPSVMKEITEIIPKLPDWKKISEARNIEAQKLRERLFGKK